MDEGLERLEDLLAEFNPFDVLKIERRETQHSALLAWLLDPRGSHGLRDYFLRRFLSEAAAKAQEEGVGSVTPLDVDGWDLGGIEVATERHNIDILLTDEGDEFFCIIENKIGAGEHSNQLARCLRIAESEYEGLVPFPIFLTPDGIEPESAGDAGRYVPLGYEKVADLIDRTLRTRGSSISTSVSGFLEQYARTLRRHVMTDADNIDELALQIYNKHRAAIDLIIKARPALEAQGWDVLDSAIARYEPLLQGDGNSKWYHRFYAPELEGIPEMREGHGWTATGRMLLFEVKYNSRTLALVLGPGPEATRRRLYNLSQANDGVPGVSMRRTQKLSPTFHTLYSRTLLGKEGSSQPDYERGRQQVENAVAAFFDSDYWRLVNAVRAEFGLPVSSLEGQIPTP
jgi:hypothetical protein